MGLSGKRAVLYYVYGVGKLIEPLSVNNLLIIPYAVKGLE
jgi:hypothetical protein